MKDFVKIYNDVTNYPSIQLIADHFSVHERTVRKKAKKLRDDGIELVDRTKPKNQIKKTLSDVPADELESEIKIRQLADQIRKLNNKLKEAHTQVSSSQELKDMIHEMKNTKTDSVPKWISKKSKRDPHELTGIPVLFLSDIHFDEVVESGQVSGVNVYNRSIAEQRIMYTFETADKLLNEYMANAVYDGFVLALGGDLLSGNIHEELAETNEAPITKSVVRLTEVLETGITQLVDKFGKVFVPCVVGNHGRTNKIKKHKNKVFDNYEWLIYQNLSNAFKNDDRVTVYIPDSPDAQFTIYNTRFLLEHGDAFRGGSGIAGIFSPLMLGAHKKNKNKSAVDKPFDIMMIGHFHQYIHTNNLIVNGSIKGYDEYAYNNNFPFEEPQQSLFIVHPTFGITFRMPVKCNGYEMIDKKYDKKVQIVF